MENFILKTLINTDIESELNKIGFDKSYLAKASNKFKYKTFKIFDLTIPQANILKQTALSFGADCGVHRDVLVNKIEKTDVILGGSYSQIIKICEKLKQQPFSLKILAHNILSLIEKENKKTKIVGILNITPDSFSDGGQYFDEKNAIQHLYQLIEDGADIIDIGAESTKPFSHSISTEEQIKRLSLVIKEISNINIPISIDTKNSEVADFALNNGAQIINDVSGGNYDPKIFNIVTKYNATIILQHSTEKTENIINYKDIVEDVYKSLYLKIKLAEDCGIKNIIIDPGIGFGKTKKQNFEILERIEEFYSLKKPTMIGISRKSLLGHPENNNNNLKDSLSLALAYPLIKSGIDYIRVHNVKLHKTLLEIQDC